MAGEIETWGSGFDKIQRACSRYGTPLPKIKATKGNVTIHIDPAESYLNVLHRTSEGDLGTSGAEVSAEVSTEVKLSSEMLNGLIDFCKEERSRKEMQEFCGIKSEKYFREKILTPMLAEGKVRRTIPDKPNSSKQKYVTVYIMKRDKKP